MMPSGPTINISESGTNLKGTKESVLLAQPGWGELIAVIWVLGAGC